jgi:hypothetical protein
VGVSALLLFNPDLVVLYQHLQVKLMAVEEEVNANLRCKARITGGVTPRVIIEGHNATGL